MNNPNFQPQIFRFNSNVKIDLALEKVIAQGPNGNSSIPAESLDNFTYVINNVQRISFFALAGRTFLTGTITSLVLFFMASDVLNALLFEASALNIFLTWGAILVFVICMLISLAVFWGPIVDMFFDFGIERMIMKSFTNFGFRVTIGNNSGNNIVFWAPVNDESKIKKLEQKINELKQLRKAIAHKQETKAPNTAPSAPTSQFTNNTSTMLEDLKKLGELYKEGILTQEEFEQKKAAILKQ